jgi:hypothetical protein
MNELTKESYDLFAKSGLIPRRTFGSRLRRGGSLLNFPFLRQAYKVLSNPARREIGGTGLTTPRSLLPALRRFFTIHKLCLISAIKDTAELKCPGTPKPSAVIMRNNFNGQNFRAGRCFVSTAERNEKFTKR